MHSTTVSGKQRKAQQQLRFIVKKEFVATYGIVTASAGSGFEASTRKVAQLPSIFSTRNTQDVSAASQLPSRVVGILKGTPFPAHVYNMIGLVLQLKVVTLQPRKPRSQVSRQLSEQSALLCRILITVKISAIQLFEVALLLLHI